MRSPHRGRLHTQPSGDAQSGQAHFVPFKTKELQGQSLIVYVTKELDHHAVIDLRATSDKLIQAGNVKHIIFDFSDVDFMDSSGIGLIMGRHKKVMFLGGKTAVTGVGKNIDRIFRMSGLYQIVEKYVTPQEEFDNL